MYKLEIIFFVSDDLYKFMQRCVAHILMQMDYRTPTIHNSSYTKRESARINTKNQTIIFAISLQVLKNSETSFVQRNLFSNPFQMRNYFCRTKFTNESSFFTVLK